MSTLYTLMGESVTLQDLDRARWEYFTKEELQVMHQKAMELLNNLPFANEQEKAFANNMFELGYIAAHTKYHHE
jgi:tRNA C32,U32 (ribose-2'-O)-methylase TrmJ